MPMSYLDLFLAFLGLTFGLPSVLPGLFFQNKDDRHPTVAGGVMALSGRAGRDFEKRTWT